MFKRFTLILAVLMMVLVSASALAKVNAPDWANIYGVVNIQRTGLYHYFEMTEVTLTGEERLGSILSGLFGGSGMMLQRKYNFAIDHEKIYGEVEDADIGEVNPENKGIRRYDFIVTPDMIKGEIKFKYRPTIYTFDLAFQENKLVGTVVNKKKKLVSNYDITFDENGNITGTMGVKRDIHKVALVFKGEEVSGTIKGSKKYGNGNYSMEIGFIVPPAISREKLSFIVLVMLHQEFLTDFYRNVDFDMPYRAHGHD